jgi:glucose/arabinose dehydrogenase/mono/diheme cytochrome c family protein
MPFNPIMFKSNLFFLCFLTLFQTHGQQKGLISKDPELIQKGKTIFDMQCGACHNFVQKGIGPQLSNVLAETDKTWLLNFIKNPSALQKKGDKRTLQLINEYKQVMPTFSLSSVELESVLAYIQINQKPINPKKVLAKDGLINPIENEISKSGKKLILEYLQTAPKTYDNIPITRINTMVKLDGEKPQTFLSDLKGIIYKFEEKQLKTYLDFQQLNPNFIHRPGLASGLGSYTFHPEFNKNGLFYTSHTEKPNKIKADFAYHDSIKVTLQWVLTEWKVKSPKAERFEGEPRELLRINMISSIHGMQEITFNPNAKKGDEDYGLLYVGIGDGGASENGFPEICATNQRLWSSVLRINPAGNNSKNGKYGIPPTNPFAQDDDDNTADEVFCRGFRNPNRIYWTRDGKMLISDIGHHNIEELNIGLKGADYGWPLREGTYEIRPQANMGQVFELGNKKEKAYSYPAIQYDHAEGNAISAGFVYDNDQIAGLKGKYIFGDVVNGRVFYVENKELILGKLAKIMEFELVLDGETINFIDICKNPKTDLRFGQGFNDQIYIYTKTDGKIYKVVGME